MQSMRRNKTDFRQLRRWSDFEQITDVFSDNEFVRVERVGSRLPPDTYWIEYRVPGLYLDGDQPKYSNIHEVEIMLPPEFPFARPHVIPMTPIFHPNINDAYLCDGDTWDADTSLVAFIAKVGEMIQWRIYDLSDPVDCLASRWGSQYENSGLFPVGNADLFRPGGFPINVKAHPKTPK